MFGLFQIWARSASMLAWEFEALPDGLAVPAVCAWLENTTAKHKVARTNEPLTSFCRVELMDPVS
jgi:hypothetical protein